MWDSALQFLESNATALGATGGLVAVILFIWGIVKWPFTRDEPTRLAPETIEQIKPPQVKDGPALTITEFIRLRRELKADLEQELAEASESEKAQLRARIAELEPQIANPDSALAEARKRIADLDRHPPRAMPFVVKFRLIRRVDQAFMRFSPDLILPAGDYLTGEVLGTHQHGFWSSVKLGREQCAAPLVAAWRDA